MQPTVRQEVQPQFEQVIAANFGEQAALEAQQPAPAEFQVPEAQTPPAQMSEGLAAAISLAMLLNRNNPELAGKILGLGVQSEMIINHGAAFARQQEMEHEARAHIAKQKDNKEKQPFASAE